jgi:AraC-like DNA-binding protein
VAELLVDRWLQERPPSSDLADAVRCVWWGDLGELRVPLPDECVDLVWLADGTVWVSGPESRSWSRTGPGDLAVGVRFRPGVGPAVLGVAGSELRDGRVPLAAALGDRRARAVTERLAASRPPAERVRELESAARHLVADGPPVDRLAVAVGDAVGRVRPEPVRELARATGLSERQLLRRSQVAFGYGPATLARIRRLQRVLQLARLARPTTTRPGRPGSPPSSAAPPLAALAADAGYADQAHLAHDVRSIMGTTPRRLLRTA